ncbi:MAG: peptidylprolyl isomerase [Planctomycetes bacterium]|nr:peptidylprolyl isomerase [Planctomycetota bacterium]
MAQHKAPTAVTIAPVQEKSGLAEFVDRFWKLGALAAIVVAGVLLYRQHARSTAGEAEAAQWTKLLGATSRDPRTGLMAGASADIAAVADQVKGSHAGPWALYLLATTAAKEGKFEDAKRALARLRQEYPTHSLVVDKLPTDTGGARQSVLESLEGRIDAQAAWRAKNPGFFANPPLPEGAPRVRINTDRGSFVVGLYTDQAPLHCDNFLTLAREGAYNGIKVHRVVADSLVQAGDPNTLNDDVATWGTGEVGVKLEPENNSLRHFVGALAAARTPGSKQSSGSQFFISISENHAYDGDYVVYGTVVEGLDVLKQISQSPVVPETERPETPAVIQSTEVL